MATSYPLSAEAGLRARLSAYSKQDHGRTKILGLQYLGSRLTSKGELGTAGLMLATAKALAKIPEVLPIAPYDDVTLEAIEKALRETIDEAVPPPG